MSSRTLVRCWSTSCLLKHCLHKEACLLILFCGSVFTARLLYGRDDSRQSCLTAQLKLHEICSSCMSSAAVLGPVSGILGEVRERQVSKRPLRENASLLQPTCAPGKAFPQAQHRLKSKVASRCMFPAATQKSWAGQKCSASCDAANLPPCIPMHVILQAVTGTAALAAEHKHSCQCFTCQVHN